MNKSLQLQVQTTLEDEIQVIKTKLSDVLQWKSEMIPWKDKIEERVNVVDEKTESQSIRINQVTEKIEILLSDIQYRKWRDRIIIVIAVIFVILFIYIIIK